MARVTRAAAAVLVAVMLAGGPVVAQETTVTVKVFISHTTEQIEAGYTYDGNDSAPRILRAYIDNNGSGTIRFTITRDDGVEFMFEAGPGTSKELTFNNSQGQKLPLELTARGPRPIGFGYMVGDAPQ